MEISVDNFRVKLIVYQEPGHFSEESKVLGVPSQEEFMIFLWNFIYMYVLCSHAYKNGGEMFLCVFCLEILWKM